MSKHVVVKSALVALLELNKQELVFTSKLFTENGKISNIQSAYFLAGKSESRQGFPTGKCLPCYERKSFLMSSKFLLIIYTLCPLVIFVLLLWFVLIDNLVTWVFRITSLPQLSVKLYIF